ncbi:MAG: formate dehydrogenase subunit beta [Burkholderiales bacterium]|jgi:formate dehydrogenase iron-sulfur subunit|nr:formate dehydrogenase subunit beta [Burkholderiales bacterium]
MKVDKHHYVTSATNPLTPAPQKYVYQQEVAKLIDTTICIGCKACQVACSEWNDYRADVGNCVGVYDNPADLGPKAWTVMRYNEVEEKGRLQWLIRKDGCMHCEQPGCQIACPVPGAIVQHSNGIVDIVQELCTGCGYCIAGCPFDVPRQNPADKRVYKCNLCVDRIAVGQEPACAKTCPTSAIMFGSKDGMKVRAEERINELKSRGFANAGLYDPQGVGGTHVMYVLHHADRPELYSGLPKNPTISPMVRFWKGAFKPLAAVGFIAMFAAAALHYIKIGPVAEGDEEEKNHD